MIGDRVLILVYSPPFLERLKEIRFQASAPGGKMLFPNERRPGYGGARSLQHRDVRTPPDPKSSFKKSVRLEMRMDL